MKRKCLGLLVVWLLPLYLMAGSADFEVDTLKSGHNDLKITFIGHGTLMFTFKDKVVHVDPWSRLTDYTQLPKADLILITHDHGDHLDAKAIKTLKKSDTLMLLTEKCRSRIDEGTIIRAGQVKLWQGLKIEAVPAYNLVNKRENGSPYHPKGEGNGYIISFEKVRIYVAGDTENTPEMKALKDIDVAFLPMNLPYTMSPEMVADAVRVFKPRILYPYHFGSTDTAKLQEILKGVRWVEIRIRKMK